MECPVCNKSMFILQLFDVEVDYCIECKGIWFDEGEIEALLNDKEAGKEFMKSFKKAGKLKEKMRRCPICKKKMNKVYCGENGNVLIDECKKNHGLWFDGGELQKILTTGNWDKDNRIIDFLKDMFKSSIVEEQQ